jgi:hypothetical protein
MTFADAPCQPCDAIRAGQLCARGEASRPFSPVHSACAGRDSDRCGSYLSGATWQTTAAGPAALSAADHLCRMAGVFGLNDYNPDYGGFLLEKVSLE